jgi:hypothetical protein
MRKMKTVLRMEESFSLRNSGELRLLFPAPLTLNPPNPVVGKRKNVFLLWLIAESGPVNSGKAGGR